MPVAQPFLQLEELLAHFLPRVAVASDRLLAFSVARMQSHRPVFPGYLAFRSFQFRWRAQSQFDGARKRFLFWDLSSSRRSARELLQAEMTLELRPTPPDEPAQTSDDTPAPIELQLPALVRTMLSPDEWSAVTPPGAQPQRTIVLRLSPTETLGIWSPAAEGDRNADVREKFTEVRWVQGGRVQDLPRGKAWPLPLFFSTARALQTDAATTAGESIDFTALDHDAELWQMVDAGLRLLRGLAPALTTPDPFAPDDPRHDLRCAWRTENVSLQAGVLVNRHGTLCGPDEEDTFQTSFELQQPPGIPGARPGIRLNLPDIVPPAELRAILLEKFQERINTTALARELNAATGGAITADDLAAWFDAERAETCVLRTDRGPRRDAVMLLLTGIINGVTVAAVFRARNVQWTQTDHTLTVALPDLDRPYAGRWEDITLPWDGLSELLAGVFSILLRWRLLLS